MELPETVMDFGKKRWDSRFTKKQRERERDRERERTVVDFSVKEMLAFGINLYREAKGEDFVGSVS
jgi:hypothetical protein